MLKLVLKFLRHLTNAADNRDFNYFASEGQVRDIHLKIYNFNYPMAEVNHKLSSNYEALERDLIRLLESICRKSFKALE